MEKVENLMRFRPSGWWERLCQLIPELGPMKGTRQPPEYHAEGDVAEHTRLAVSNCPEECDPDLLWTALLHDIGKPSTTEISPEGKITAHGHANKSAEMAENILTRFDMSASRKEKIIWAVKCHGFYHSWQLNDYDGLSKRQRRFLEDPKFPFLLEFLKIDSSASQMSCDNMKPYNFYKKIYDQHISKVAMHE